MFLHILLLWLIKFSAALNDNPRIKQLTEENYDFFLEKHERPVVITVYSPFCKECENLHHVSRIAEELKDVITFASINYDIERELIQRLGIKNHHVHYIVENKQLKKIKDALTKNIVLELTLYEVVHKLTSANKHFLDYFDHVTILSDENFDLLVNLEEIWFVLFYNPKSVEIRQILSVWIKGANLLKGKLNFGLLDIKKSPESADKYMIKEFATGLLKINEKEYFLHHNVHLSPEFIVEWVNSKISEYNDGSDVAQIINQSLLDKCLSKKFCIISFLPHIFDCQKNCRNNYLQIIQDINQKYKEHDWGWLWTESGAQTHLEKNLKIDDDTKLPLMAMINSEKNRYVFLRSAFKIFDLDNSLQNALKKEPAGYAYKRNVKIYDVDMWDGEDKEKNHFDFFDFDFAKTKDEL